MNFSLGAPDVSAYSRFVQRIRRRYTAEYTLLAPGEPRRTGMENALAALRAQGMGTGAALRVLRQLVIERLVVLGGGPIGCELAQSFARLGSQVTQVEMAPRLLMREDVDASDLVTARFRAEGIDVRLNHTARRIEVVAGEKVLIAEHAQREVRIPFDALLVAVGRSANLKGFGLEELGVATGRTVEVNAYLQTTRPATWRGHTSSRTPRRIRPGMPRSTRCSTRSRSSAPITA